MAPLIEAGPPATWQDLEAQVAQILRECRYDVQQQRPVQLARGEANIDVWADEHSSPPNVIAVECKNWAAPATRHEVHAFRTVVGDSGANTGLLVSAVGFQSGALAAASYSNVRLLDWTEFQEMFVVRWFRNFFSPTLGEQTEALHEYTEPINTRIFTKADALSEDRRERFKGLREQHAGLAALNFLFHPVVIEHLLPDDASPVPHLPFGEGQGADELVGMVPGDVLNATALRPFLLSLLRASEEATAEFDAVFGERA